MKRIDHSNVCSSVYFVLLHVVAIVSVVAIVAVTISSYPKQDSAREAHQKHYVQMMKYHRRVDQHVTSGAVLFVGDSHIQSMAVSSVCSRAVNFGIGGDTIAGLIARLKSYRSISLASCLVVEIGFNDLRSTDDDSEISGRFEELLDALPDGLAICVCAIIPVSQEHEHAQKLNDRIASLNEKLRESCELRSNCRFLSAEEMGLTQESSSNGQIYESDGVHLSAIGYMLWIATLRSELESYCLEI